MLHTKYPAGELAIRKAAGSVSNMEAGVCDRATQWLSPFLAEQSSFQAATAQVGQKAGTVMQCTAQVLCQDCALGTLLVTQSVQRLDVQMAKLRCLLWRQHAILFCERFVATSAGYVAAVYVAAAYAFAAVDGGLQSSEFVNQSRLPPLQQRY